MWSLCLSGENTEGLSGPSVRVGEHKRVNWSLREHTRFDNGLVVSQTLHSSAVLCVDVFLMGIK